MSITKGAFPLTLDLGVAHQTGHTWKALTHAHTLLLVQEQ